MVPFLLERQAAVARRHVQGAAGWLPSGPWLLPTARLLQTVVGSARLEENDLNFFLFFGFIILLVYFVFSPFGGYSEWAGPLGETQLPLLASF